MKIKKNLSGKLAQMIRSLIEMVPTISLKWKIKRRAANLAINVILTSQMTVKGLRIVSGADLNDKSVVKENVAN